MFKWNQKKNSKVYSWLSVDGSDHTIQPDEEQLLYSQGKKFDEMNQTTKNRAYNHHVNILALQNKSGKQYLTNLSSYSFTNRNVTGLVNMNTHF